MNRTAIWMVVAVAATVLLSGCKGGDDDFAPAVVPKTFVFEGKFDPKYVGTWKSADGSSTMDLTKDGDLKIETKSRSIAGNSVSNVSGKWLADGSSLLFRYVVGSQEPTVLKYTATLSGTTLTLQLDGAKVKTTYQRK